MKRREFMRLVGAAAYAWPCAVAAQAAAGVYRIATLNLGNPVTAESPPGAAICRGLAKHGYTRGQNLQFESRGADMERDRLPRLLDELVASKVSETGAKVMGIDVQPLGVRGRTILSRLSPA